MPGPENNGGIDTADLALIERFKDVFGTGKGTNETSAPMVTPKDAYRYDMNHRSRGKAIIFNNKNFVGNRLPERNGTDIDRDELKATLEGLGFSVTIFNDPKLSEIKNALQSLAREDHSDHDCVVVAMLSHGKANSIYSSDQREPFNAEVLWEGFTPDLSPTLAGKPKIFLIQACQGDKRDTGSSLVLSSRVVTDAAAVGGSRSYRIPDRADFLVVFSAVPGYVAWLNESRGSWFVQALNKVLSTHASHMDLLSMLTVVSREVALNFESRNPSPALSVHKPVPYTTSTLTREIYF